MTEETYNKILGIREFIDIFTCDPFYSVKELENIKNELKIMLKKCDHDIPNDKSYVNSGLSCPICKAKVFTFVMEYPSKYSYNDGLINL